VLVFMQLGFSQARRFSTKSVTVKIRLDNSEKLTKHPPGSTIARSA